MGAEGVERMYTREELVSLLRNFVKTDGGAPTTTELRHADGMPSPTTYRHHFGSWNNALRAAGFRPNRDPSPEELLTELRDFADRLDQAPTAADARDTDHIPSPDTYYRKFGSWNAALQAAGLEPNYQYTVPQDDKPATDPGVFGTDSGHQPARQDVD